MKQIKTITGGLVVSFLIACSPQLNWREVGLGNIKVLLPCKPEHAQRVVTINGAEYPMQMLGCEAAEESSYSLSKVEIAKGDKFATLKALREVIWSNLNVQRNNIQIIELKTTDVQHAERYKAVGKLKSGGSLEADISWLVTDDDIYMLAVYAPKITDAMTEMLYQNITVQ